MADRGHEDLVLPQRRQPPASPRLAGDVAGTVAEAAGLGSAHHLRHQRRTSSHLDQRRSGELYDQYLQPDWRERIPIRRSGIWCWRFPIRNCGTRIAAANAAWSPLCANAPSALRCTRQASAAEVRRLDDMLDPERVHHRVCAPVRHLQAGHAAVPRRRPAETDSHQSGYAGADRDRGQGASQRSSGQDADPRNCAAFARSRSFGQPHRVRRRLRH